MRPFVLATAHQWGAFKEVEKKKNSKPAKRNIFMLWLAYSTHCHGMFLKGKAKRDLKRRWKYIRLSRLSKVDGCQNGGRDLGGSSEAFVPPLSVGGSTLTVSGMWCLSGSRPCAGAAAGAPSLGVQSCCWALTAEQLMLLAQASAVPPTY